MKKIEYNYVMSEVEYDKYLENYLSNFIKNDFEKITLDIYDNCLDAEYLLNIVNKLDTSFTCYNLIFDQIIQIPSKNLYDINEVKKIAICKMLKFKKIETILYYFKNYIDLSNNINYYFTENMLTSLLFQIINKINKNEFAFLLFNLEQIIESIIKLNCFNNFHKKLLLKHLNENNLVDKIMLKNHKFNQYMYKSNCDDEEILSFFNFK